MVPSASRETRSPLRPRCRCCTVRAYADLDRWACCRRGYWRVGSGFVRLGLNLGYWGAGNDADNLELAKEAERLGFAVVWAAEAYGSDAPTGLAWVAAHTSRVDVGSAILQIPARTPAMAAMTAATLD